MKPEYTVGAVVLALVAGGVGFLFFPSQTTVTVPISTQEQETATSSPARTGDEKSAVAKIPAQKGTPYTEIVNPSGFVNTGLNPDGSTRSITIKELIGKKVIVVDFLTYSCINCQRTFPYLNAWYKKYKDQGLEIIGIHTPEFAFEKDINNVREAMQKFGITHPIVLDNDYATWRAYGNQYWPRKYIIDIHGNVVYDHIGEGKYEETETEIRQLLAERAQVLGAQVPMDEMLVASSMPEVRTSANSPETYFGSARNEYLANGVSHQAGEQTFVLPKIISRNALYLNGTWNLDSEYAQGTTGDSVVYRYNAKDVYIVATADTATGIEVLQDGKIVTTSRGGDVDAEGIMTVRGSTLYRVIHNASAGEHVLELKLKGTVRLYAFTFG